MQETVAILALVLIAAIILLRPINGKRYRDGHYYRASPEGFKKLSELRALSNQIVRGLPPSFRKWWVLLKLRRCIFVEVTAESEKPYLALTIDKGREMHICLDNSNEEALTFVLIHELAHVMSFSTGHNGEFYRNMDRLLRSARKQNLYTAPPTKRVIFCGSHIDMH